jgi:hypothetical protein
MAHFAKLNEDNTVIAVHSVNNEVITIDGIESEQVGIDFLSGLHGHSLWKQTFYSGSSRKNYAGIGFFYNQELNAFIPPKPYNSWILNEETCIWEAPTPMPEDENIYIWDEESLSWQLVTID